MLRLLAVMACTRACAACVCCVYTSRRTCCACRFRIPSPDMHSHFPFRCEYSFFFLAFGFLPHSIFRILFRVFISARTNWAIACYSMFSAARAIVVNKYDKEIANISSYRCCGACTVPRHTGCEWIGTTPSPPPSPPRAARFFRTTYSRLVRFRWHRLPWLFTIYAIGVGARSLVIFVRWRTILRSLYGGTLCPAIATVVAFCAYSPSNVPFARPAIWNLTFELERDLQQLHFPSVAVALIVFLVVFSAQFWIFRRVTRCAFDVRYTQPVHTLLNIRHALYRTLLEIYIYANWSSKMQWMELRERKEGKKRIFNLIFRASIFCFFFGATVSGCSREAPSLDWSFCVQLPLLSLSHTHTHTVGRVPWASWMHAFYCPQSSEAIERTTAWMYWKENEFLCNVNILVAFPGRRRHRRLHVNLPKWLVPIFRIAFTILWQKMAKKGKKGKHIGRSPLPLTPRCVCVCAGEWERDWKASTHKVFNRKVGAQERKCICTMNGKAKYVCYDAIRVYGEQLRKLDKSHRPRMLPLSDAFGSRQAFGRNIRDRLIALCVPGSFESGGSLVISSCARESATIHITRFNSR